MEYMKTVFLLVLLGSTYSLSVSLDISQNFINDVNLLAEKFVFNATLDTKYEKEDVWTLPRTDTIPKWFNYYNHSTLLKEQLNENEDSSCASLLSEEELNALSDAEGVWSVCQDPMLPQDCDVSLTDPCHPTIKYEGHYQQGLKTLKFKFALYGLATLRFYPSEKALFTRCIDYSLRVDSLSQCEQKKLGRETVDGWNEIVFTFPPELNVSMSSFKIDLIARFGSDVLLLDKIEGTEYLLCGDDHTVCTPATTTTTEIPTETTEPETETTTSKAPELTTEENSSEPPELTSTGKAEETTEVEVTHEGSSSSSSTENSSRNPSSTTTTATTTSTKDPNSASYKLVSISMLLLPMLLIMKK